MVLAVVLTQCAVKEDDANPPLHTVAVHSEHDFPLEDQVQPKRQHDLQTSDRDINARPALPPRAAKTRKEQQQSAEVLGDFEEQPPPEQGNPGAEASSGVQ